MRSIAACIKHGLRGQAEASMLTEMPPPMLGAEVRRPSADRIEEAREVALGGRGGG